jgi:glycosyltransferase involved in cell wall biosynthesis
MKVLHILNELKFSGAEIMLKVAKRKFEENNIETFVLSTGDIVGEFSNELEKNEYTIKHIPFKKNFRFTYSVFIFLRKNKFDVVHIHSERFFFFYILIAKFARINNIIRTIHSTFKFNGWLKFRRKMMLKLGCILGCKYISISKGVYDNELKLNNIKTILINNWIDTEYFKPLSNKKNESDSIKNHLNLISVGACSQVKRHFYILELVKVLKNEGYTINYFHLGAGELEDTEKKLAAKLNITEAVQFMGNQNNILPFLHQSDFFIMPSEYEGLGNTCLEAMAAGIIPIVSSVPGLIDLVTDELNGLVVNFDDIHDVVLKLKKLHNDEIQKKYFRNNARKKVAELYGLNNIDKQIALYFEK